jgi:hypothetical protein
VSQPNPTIPAPRTVTELIDQAVGALQRREIETLEELQRVAESWVQPRAERTAQVLLLQSLIDVCCNLLDFEADA